MFGKIFESLYTGSMIGAGSHVFAVWGYVIANQKPVRRVGMQVELNPKLLSAIIGEDVQRIQKAIDYLCAPDPESRTKEKGGRRLIRLGQFDYLVVNGEMYRRIRNEEARREQNREAQDRFRKKATKGTPLPGETAYEKALNNGDDAAAELLLDGDSGPGD